MGDKIGIDGGCVFGYKLNYLEISEEGEYKTYFVKKIEDKILEECEEAL